MVWRWACKICKGTRTFLLSDSFQAAWQGRLWQFLKKISIHGLHSLSATFQVTREYYYFDRSLRRLLHLPASFVCQNQRQGNNRSRFRALDKRRLWYSLRDAFWQQYRSGAIISCYCTPRISQRASYRLPSAIHFRKQDCTQKRLSFCLSKASDKHLPCPGTGFEIMLFSYPLKNG